MFKTRLQKQFLEENVLSICIQSDESLGKYIISALQMVKLATSLIFIVNPEALFYMILYSFASESKVILSINIRKIKN